MKRILSAVLILVLLSPCLPAAAKALPCTEPEAQTARTTLLDLSNQTTAISNTAEGWAFDPHGYNNNPQLTLNSYGSANQHSAPISLPRDTRVLVNGTCYIDNVYMEGPYSVLAGSTDGYLIIDGSGTLNLYATEYNGRCIDIPGGPYNNQREILYINDLTVNCFAREPDMYNASTNEACIYSTISIYINNAVINTHNGGCGIRAFGHTPIGGVTEETASEIVINNSDVDIEINANDNVWNYAQGIRTTFGKIRITGNSNVNISAGSCSIYSYLSFTIEGGNVNILSTPLSYSVGVYAIVYCGSLRLMNGMGNVYFGTRRGVHTDVVWSMDRSESMLGNEVVFELGSFENDAFLSEPDPDNNDLPAIKAHGNGQSWSGIMGDADNDGSVSVMDALLVLRYAMGLISSLPAIQAADVDSNGVIDVSDALKILRIGMGLVQGK